MSLNKTLMVKTLMAKTLMASTAVVLSLAASPVLAQSSGLDVEILQLLVDEGVIPYDKAKDVLARARQKQEEDRQAEQAQKSAAVIDVPYVPETVRQQIKAEVKQEVVAEAKAQGWIAPNVMPGWVERVRVSGDFRARFQNEDVPDSVLGANGELIEGNFPYFPDVAAINKAGGVTDAQGFPLLNSTVDRRRPNYRARLKFEADINDKVMVGLRLASGDDASPISTNSTFGEHFYKDALWIDQAYLDIKPVEGLKITAGRMPNPFYSTDLLWDADINPEGLAVSGRHDFGSVKAFATAAVLPLQERELFDDSYLYAAQGGVEGRFGGAFGFKAALAYYDFQNVQSLKNAPDGSRLNDWSAPKYLSKGNSVFNMRTDGLTTLAGLASRFELATFTGQLSYGQGPRSYRLTTEIVQNQGVDAAEIAALRGEPGVEPGDLGWQVRFDAGYPVVAERGQWRVAAAYKHVETDAVMDIFTDSDFALGGTDVEGYVLEAEYGIYKNTAVGVTWLSSDSISRPPFSLDVVQLNLNVRY